MKNAVFSEIENLINTLLQKHVSCRISFLFFPFLFHLILPNILVCTSWLSKILSKQKKTDYRQKEVVQQYVSQNSVWSVSYFFHSPMDRFEPKGQFPDVSFQSRPVDSALNFWNKSSNKRKRAGCHQKTLRIISLKSELAFTSTFPPCKRVFAPWNDCCSLKGPF